MNVINEKRDKLSKAGRLGNTNRWSNRQLSPPDRKAIPTQSQVKESKEKESKGKESKEKKPTLAEGNANADANALQMQSISNTSKVNKSKVNKSKVKEKPTLAEVENYFIKD